MIHTIIHWYLKTMSNVYSYLNGKDTIKLRKDKLVLVY